MPWNFFQKTERKTAAEVLRELRAQFQAILPALGSARSSEAQKKAIQDFIQQALSWKDNPGYYCAKEAGTGYTLMHRCAAAGLTDFFDEKYFNRFYDPKLPKDRKQHDPLPFRYFYEHDKCGFAPMHYAALNGQIPACRQLYGLYSQSDTALTASDKGETFFDILKFCYEKLVHELELAKGNKSVFYSERHLMSEIERIQKTYHVIPSKDIPSIELINQLHGFYKACLKLHLSLQPSSPLFSLTTCDEAYASSTSSSQSGSLERTPEEIRRAGAKI